MSGIVHVFNPQGLKWCPWVGGGCESKYGMQGFCPAPWQGQVPQGVDKLPSEPLLGSLSLWGPHSAEREAGA